MSRFDAPYFWDSTIGIICTAILLITSLLIIVKTKHCIIDTLYHWVLAGVCVISFLHISEDTIQTKQVAVIIIALTVKKLWDTYMLFKRGGNNGH